jgi:hypothetical protein
MEWMNIFLRLLKTPVYLQPKIIIIKTRFESFESIEGLLESVG